MARIRTIKPEFWKHEDLCAEAECTHMLAGALLNYADDEGYFLANPALVKAECCPLRETSLSTHDMLLRLQKIGYVELGKGPDGKSYGRIAKFEDHQRVNRPTPSKIKALSIVFESSQTTHGALTEDSSPERKGKEGKGREEKLPSSLRSDVGSDKPTPPKVDPPKSPTDLAARRAERLAAVTDSAIEAYNRILGKPNGRLAAVRVGVGRKTRQAQVKRMLQVASEICLDRFGSKKITPDFWENHFGACSDDPFCNGTGPYDGEHENWRPDFEYLTRPKTVLKIFERAIDDDESPEAGAR